MSIFSKVQSTHVKSNTFDLGHQRKFSMEMGKLVPILCMETLPGDKFKINTSQLLRFAPLVAPVMHHVTCYTHYFFVPNRILWDGWKTFITGGDGNEPQPVFPKVKFQAVTNGTLADYLGLPQFNNSTAPEQEFSALPFAAYHNIYNEYYRDQNLIDEVDITLKDGINTVTPFLHMHQRAWQHDYFTSALPWTQKGSEAQIPLGNITEAHFVNDAMQWPSSFTKENLQVIPPTDPAGSKGHLTAQAKNGTDQAVELRTQSSTINDLRRAFKLQEWLEKNARGGSRYNESILSHFGVKTSDSRLQRPEYLGGSGSPVQISEVLQTSETLSSVNTPNTPQGNMSGHAISVGSSGNISHYCEEHGYIIGIMSVMPKTAYQQGIPKHFKKFDKFDYYFPSFAHLGEQPILNEELYLGNDGLNELTFGYTPRYAEYKYQSDTVHGEFRTTLDKWHMGRKFSNRPLLNQDFIDCTADETNRIFAVLTGEHMYVHVNHQIKAKRKMPYFGTPKF